ncbi:MAG: hypothetical protein KDK62_07710 [Chlamydiia bacterium]|nr:hypothetical protein [Chlamydiia bacterium]
MRIVLGFILSLSLYSCGMRDSREIVIVSSSIDALKPFNKVQGEKGEVFEAHYMDTQEIADRFGVDLKGAKQIQAFGDYVVAVEGRNFMPGESWKIYSGSVLGLSPGNFTFTANEHGELVDLEKGIELRNFFSSMCLPCPGEPNILLLISLDTHECLRLNLIPRPIEHSWGDGAKVSLVLGKPNGLVYYVYGDGFKSEETIKAFSVSSGEKRQFDIRTNEKGSFYLVLEPGVIGFEGGRAVLSLTRIDCGEDNPSAKIGYSWGKAVNNR